MLYLLYMLVILIVIVVFGFILALTNLFNTISKCEKCGSNFLIEVEGENDSYVECLDCKYKMSGVKYDRRKQKI